MRKYLEFSLCNTCCRFIDQRRTCTDPVERERLLAEEREHFEFVRKERGSYYTRRKHGIYCRGDYLSLIMDSADQAAYGLPHFLEHDKVSSSVQKNRLHIMCTLAWQGRVCLQLSEQHQTRPAGGKATESRHCCTGDFCTGKLVNLHRQALQ